MSIRVWSGRRWLLLVALTTMFALVPSVSVVADEHEAPPAAVISDDDPIVDDENYDPGPVSLRVANEPEPRAPGFVRGVDADVVDDVSAEEWFASAVSGGDAVVPVTGGRVHVGAGMFAVDTEPLAFGGRGDVRVKIDAATEVAPEGSLVPLVTVDFVDDAGVRVEPLSPVELVFDYSSVPAGWYGSLTGRMKLQRFAGCNDVDKFDADGDFEGRVTVCDTVTDLDAVNDVEARVLRYRLLVSDLGPVGVAPIQAAASSGLGSGSGRISAGAGGARLPRVGALAAFSGGTGGFGVGGGVSDGNGNFGASPAAGVADYQVSLFTGAFATSVPFAVPAPQAGPAPSVGLSYSSSVADGMQVASNNQPGPVGIGWSLGAGGSISRSFAKCDSTDDLCPLEDQFTLSLNGVSSRIVVDDGATPTYHLENEQFWTIDLRTDETPTTQDVHDEWWEIITPDGVTYRFGYNDDSADWVPVYSPSGVGVEWCDGTGSDYCSKTRVWNLDQVQDTVGNTVTYTYFQENNWYDPDNTTELEYIRASFVDTIEYTSNTEPTTDLTSHARVKFVTEVRCKDPDSTTDCGGDEDMKDTPYDLACRDNSTSCAITAPTFWTERRYSDILMQVKNEHTGQWETRDWWHLDVTFPTSQGTESEPKMWLNEIVQRETAHDPDAGDSGEPVPDSWPAYIQFEGEGYDAKNLAGTPSSNNAKDHGQGTFAWNTDPSSSYLKWEGVDFGDTAPDSLLVRYSSKSTVAGTLEWWIDATTTGAGGTKIATLTVTDTGGYQNWATGTDTTVSSSATGVHDLFLVFNQTTGSTKLAYVNWFRFAPDGTLDGLPPTEYDRVDLEQRTEGDAWLPRIDRVINPLGGTIDVTYGQTEPMHSTPGDECYHSWDPTTGDAKNQRRNCDFFAGWDPHASTYKLYNIYKVLEIKADTPNTESVATFTTYDYGTPEWRYSNSPGANFHTGTGAASLDCATQPCNLWNDFRGHDWVEVNTVANDNGSAGDVYQTTKYYFYQGMDGDWNGDTGWDHSQSITLHNGTTTRTDDNWLAGQIAEVVVMDGAATPVVLTDTINTYATDTDVQVTATQDAGLDTERKARFAPRDQVKATNEPAATDTRTTKVETEYDDYGRVTGVIDWGQSSPGVSTDNLYTEYRYVVTESEAPNDPMRDRVQYVKTWAGSSAGTAGDELAITRYFYDDQSLGVQTDGLLTTTRVWSHIDPVETDVTHDTDYTHDEYGRVVTVTDDRGNKTHTAYDSGYGYVTSTTAQYGATQDGDDLVTDVTEWDEVLGVPLETQDFRDKATELAYDTYGRLASVTLPTESTDPTYKYTYTLSSTKTAPAVVKTQTLYVDTPGYLDSYAYLDGFGRSIQTQTKAETSGNRIITGLYFNDHGQVAREATPWEHTGEPGTGYIDPAWTSNPTMDQQVAHTYDDHGRVTMSETLNGDATPAREWKTEWAYDVWDQDITNPRGNTTSYAYDARGNLTQVSEPGDLDTTYDYDRLSRLTKVTDAAATPNVVEIEYDDLGRKKKYIDQVDHEWDYEYDDVGNLTQQTDPEGDVLVFTYDDLNRMTLKEDGSGTDLAKWEYVTNSSSSQLGLLAYTEAYHHEPGTTTLAWTVKVDPNIYDAQSRITKQTWSITDETATPSPTTDSYVYEYAYDKAGRPDTIKYPTGETVTYTYRTRTGQPHTLDTDVTGHDIIVKTASWNERGQPVSQQYGFGSDKITKYWDYDADTLRIDTIRAGLDTSGYNVARWDYTYQLNGNIASVKDARNSSQFQCFTYNTREMVNVAYTGDVCDGTHDTTGNGPYYWDYDYNAVGNITQVTDKTGASDVDYDYTYGASQGTYDALPHAVTTYDPSDTSATTYSYDKNGNQTGRGSHTLTWDPNNRLVEYDNGSEVTEYVYDTEGRRVIRIDDADGTPTVTYYIGGYEIEDPGGTETESTYYMFAGTQVAVRVDDGTTDTRHYLITDHLGSNSVSVEYETTTKNRTFYHPYGEVRATTGGGVDTDHTYTGQIHDGTATGLMYYNARYYDPTLRRFISPDVLVQDAADPQTLNRYTYVRNNPLRLTDPSGRCFIEDGVFLYDGPCLSWTGEGPNNMVPLEEAALVAEMDALYETNVEAGNEAVYSDELAIEIFNPPLYGDADQYAYAHAYTAVVDHLQLSPKLTDLLHPRDSWSVAATYVDLSVCFGVCGVGSLQIDADGTTTGAAGFALWGTPGLSLDLGVRSHPADDYLRKSDGVGVESLSAEVTGPWFVGGYTEIGALKDAAGGGVWTGAGFSIGTPGFFSGGGANWTVWESSGPR